MKRMKVWILCVACVMLLGCGMAPGFASVNNDVMRSVLNATEYEAVAFGDTVSMGGIFEMSIPADWEKMPEDEMTEAMVFQYKGTDDAGVTCTFAGVIADRWMAQEQGLSSYDDFRRVFDEEKTSYIVTIFHDINLIFSGDDATVEFGFCLTREGDILCLALFSETNTLSEVFASEKLLNDFTAIIQSMKCDDPLKMMDLVIPPPTGREARTAEPPVVFQDRELERMLREAMHKSAEDRIYPADLAAVSTLGIRTGHLSFSRDVQGMDTMYEQPGVLELADLALFPNLQSLDITDMDCAGFETLAALPELKNLTLIRVGLTDCGFLQGVRLNELNLAIHWSC